MKEYNDRWTRPLRPEVQHDEDNRELQTRFAHQDETLEGAIDEIADLL